MAPGRDARPPPRRTKPPPAPPEQPRRARFSRSAVSPQRSPPPSLALTAAYRPVSPCPEPPRAGNNSHRGRPSLAAGAPLTGHLSPPTQRPNRTPSNPRPSPVLSRPRTPASSPNSGNLRRPAAPRGHIAKKKFFPGSVLQKFN
jgi:hypothetical protein